MNETTQDDGGLIIMNSWIARKCLAAASVYNYSPRILKVKKHIKGDLLTECRNDLHYQSKGFHQTL